MATKLKHIPNKKFVEFDGNLYVRTDDYFVPADTPAWRVMHDITASDIQKMNFDILGDDDFDNRLTEVDTLIDISADITDPFIDCESTNGAVNDISFDLQAHSDDVDEKALEYIVDGVAQSYFKLKHIEEEGIKTNCDPSNKLAAMNVIDQYAFYKFAVKHGESEFANRALIQIDRFLKVLGIERVKAEKTNKNRRFTFELQQHAHKPIDYSDRALLKAIEDVRMLAVKIESDDTYSSNVRQAVYDTDRALRDEYHRRGLDHDENAENELMDIIDRVYEARIMKRRNEHLASLMEIYAPTADAFDAMIEQMIIDAAEVPTNENIEEEEEEDREINPAEPELTRKMSDGELLETIRVMAFGLTILSLTDNDDETLDETIDQNQSDLDELFSIVKQYRNDLTDAAYEEERIARHNAEYMFYNDDFYKGLR